MSTTFRTPLRPRTRVALALIIAWLACGVAWADHPNQPQGFDAIRAYQTGLDQIDQVDLYSGRLSLTIPVGPFSLIYNSNVWRYQAWDDGDGVSRIRATPDEQNTGGLGWYLGWGEVYHASHWYNGTGKWLFVGDDGGRHVFYGTLHRGETNVDPNVYYTRDGTYLRLRVHNNYFVDIEYPDGTTRRFDSGTGGLGTTYRLTKTWQPFSSAADPDIEITYSADGLTRAVSDRYGRTHYVHLRDDFPWIQKVVSQIDLQGFADERAVYDFHYTLRNLDVSCKDDSSSTPARIAVPHLRMIQRPDGTSYQMEDTSGLLYNNFCGAGQDDLSGTLSGIELPTGGGIRWSYQTYEFPPGDNHSVFNTSSGVADRRLFDRAGSLVGRWTYRTSSIGATDTEDPEVYTEIVTPTGDCTKHYFNARYWVTPSQGRGWELGLPFVYSQSSGGRFLSSETWSASSGGACAGTKLRSTYLRFRRDATPGSGSAPAIDWYNTNRQVDARRVVFHDDGNRYIDTEWLDFDGLGHFRREVTTGNLRTSATLERRETRTTFNRTTGTYPGSYVPVLPSEPWILGIFDSIEVEEPDAFGSTVSRVEVDFERDTGFLSCLRVLAEGTGRGTADVVTRFERDALGQVTDTKHYGGDRQSLSTLGAGCGDMPSQPAHWTTSTYRHGVLATTRPRTPGGGEAPFLTYDADVDWASGLVTQRRGVAGTAATFDYDRLGRTTFVGLDSGSSNHFAYLPATASSDALVQVVRRGSDGAEVARTEVVYDAFGRPHLERNRLPGGAWASRETKRNARGWVTSVSRWGDPTRKTEYLDYDAFGRARTIRPPSASASDILLTYQGTRRVTRKMKRQLATTEAYVTYVSHHDSHGRLRTVEEPSGSGGAATPTTYDYDVAGNLRQIVSGPSSGPQQVRRFDYDNRGFLRFEQHPELGLHGNGRVEFHDYDALGRPGRRVDGTRDLGFTYDNLGRLTRISDRANANRPLTEWAYDGAAGDGLGKLWRATQHNYVDLPWTSASVDDVQVRTTLAYQGPGGQVSSKATRLWWTGSDATFEQTYDYDDLGDIVEQGYPRCIDATCAADTASTAPDIAYAYDEGRLTRVAGWAPQITYHASGAWKAITHANGVTDHQDLDAVSGRVRRLFTTGVAAGQDYDSGIYAYDGSGNVRSIGADAFAYDPAGRLTRASLAGVWQQSFAYDRFGNLTSMTSGTGGTQSFAVDATTNRIAGAISYDASGNVASWGNLQFTYNESNRLTGQAYMRYVYDAEGERVGAFANVPVPNMKVSLRELDGRLLTQVQWDGASWDRDRDYVYVGQRLLAAVAGDGTPLHHYHLDHTGSPRLLTRPDGVAQTETLIAPYGHELPFETADLRKLGSHERDASTGTDYMHARHYASGLGRFLSIDPVLGNTANPQRLNRYAYVLNNPVNRVDPDGRTPEPYVESGKRIVIESGEYRIVRHSYDRAHSAPGHFHVYRRKGGALLARVARDGKVLTGKVTEAALKIAEKAGLLVRKGGAKLIPYAGTFIALAIPGETSYAADLTPEEIAQLYAGTANFYDHEPYVWQSDENVVDPTTGQPIVIDETIDVIDEAHDPTAGGESDGTDASGDDNGAGADNDGRPDLVDLLRAGWSIRELWDFSCMMSPTTCYQGFGGGGGGVHTHIRQYY